MWRIRAQRSKEVLHLQTNERRFPAHTWGPRRVWGSPSIWIWKHSNFRVRTVSECLLDAGLICSSIQNSSAGPRVREWGILATMATAARLSEVCMEMRSRKRKEARRRKTLANTRVSLPESANIPTWCGSLCPPSVGGQKRAGVVHLHAYTRTHTHTLWDVQVTEDAEPTWASCISVNDDS